jgi:hypothetical protein
MEPAIASRRPAPLSSSRHGRRTSPGSEVYGSRDEREANIGLSEERDDDQIADLYPMAEGA